MKTITLISAAAALLATAAVSTAGTLDAAEPIVRDYSVSVAIEPGYISQTDIAYLTRGDGRGEASGSEGSSSVQ